MPVPTAPPEPSQDSLARQLRDQRTESDRQRLSALLAATVPAPRPSQH